MFSELTENGMGEVRGGAGGGGGGGVCQPYPFQGNSALSRGQQIGSSHYHSEMPLREKQRR